MWAIKKGVYGIRSLLVSEAWWVVVGGGGINNHPNNVHHQAQVFDRLKQ